MSTRSRNVRFCPAPGNWGTRGQRGGPGWAPRAVQEGGRTAVGRKLVWDAAGRGLEPVHRGGRGLLRAGRGSVVAVT